MNSSSSSSKEIDLYFSPIIVLFDEFFTPYLPDAFFTTIISYKIAFLFLYASTSSCSAISALSGIDLAYAFAK